MKKILTLIFTLAIVGGVSAQQVQDDDVVVATESVAADEMLNEVVAAEETIAEAKEELAEVVEEKLDANRRNDGYDPRTDVPKRHYINLSFATQKLDHPDFTGTIKAKEAAAIEFGSTFFFNGKNPVLTPGFGAIRFGLDFSYLDATYARFEYTEDGEKIESHFGNIGMQVGPSVTFTPLRKLNVKLYAHYAPSFVAFTLGKDFDEVTYGYAGYITGGLQASYRFVTLGFELRGSTTKLASISEDNFSGEIDPPAGIPGSIDEVDVNWSFDKGNKKKTKLPGARFTLGFRF